MKLLCRLFGHNWEIVSAWIDNSLVIGRYCQRCEIEQIFDRNFHYFRTVEYRLLKKSKPL